MNKLITGVLCSLLLACGPQEREESTPYEAHLIPAPVSIEKSDQSLLIDGQISFSIETEDDNIKKHVAIFEDFLSSIQIQTVPNANTAVSVRLHEPKKDLLGDEGYELNITQQGIEIDANRAAGVFNALQTLRQFFPPSAGDSDGSISIETGKIVDYPRFAWRGLMLDVSRHFFSVEDVKAYLDKMAQFKFNVFHWHLTDDEGWRIEIKALPKLTEVGAWRVERHGRFGATRPYPRPNEKASYGGYYTQEQIKEIIAYAADRNITIVPEIDMPGHMMAALAAYPELSTKKEPKFVNPGSEFIKWDGPHIVEVFHENTLNPVDEKVYEFIDKVFTEVAELFPGEYIHMGGDEAFHGFWKADPNVRNFMNKNDIKDTYELQSYFVKRVEEIISSKGKKTIGWDEILDGGLAEGAAVMSWRGIEGGIKAAKMGHNVVMSPKYFVYLDYTQGDHSVENPIYLDLSLEKTYSFEPVPEGVDPNYILGGQGNLWTEVIPNLQYAYYMTYPRAFAIAESLWSPKEKKDWNGFIARTEGHFSRFDSVNTNISKAVLDPIIQVYKENDQLMVALKNSIPNTEIYYTIDNTYPVKFGEKYEEPFEIPQGNLSLRTQTYRDGKPISRQLQIHREDLVARVK